MQLISLIVVIYNQSICIFEYTIKEKEIMKNQITITDKRIKASFARLYRTQNSCNNANHTFTDKDLIMQFDSNEDGISYVKNHTFKSSPIWETLNDRFIATTEKNYNVLIFIS